MRVLRRLPAVALLSIAATALYAPPPSLALSKAIWGDVSRNGVDQFPLYRRLGVSIYQTYLAWDQVAPTRPAHATDPRDPAYAWPAGLDRAVAEARRFHMRVLVQIDWAPAWANGGSPDHRDAPVDPADFANFAAAAARRYPTVHLWMIWGEPDREANWQPMAPARPGALPLTPAQQVAPQWYARVLDAAYGALKRVSRANLVIGGDTYSAGDLDPFQWISSMRLPSGKPPRMDMYGHNPFTDRDPTFTRKYSRFHEVRFSDLPELAHWVDLYLHPGLPLFLSEWTIPTKPDDEFTFYVDPPVAARWITEALREARRWHRIYALGWIHVYDDPPTSYGGLMTVTGRRKPLFTAFERG